MGDYFLDPNITIKEEMINDNVLNSSSSASVPIPLRVRELNDYHDNFSPIQLHDESSNNQWSIMNTEEMLKNDLIQMDDDDIFQVDKADLIQGPTLAELNANVVDTDLTDLNFDDLLLPDEHSIPNFNLNNNLFQQQSTSLPTQHNNSVFLYHNQDFIELFPNKHPQQQHHHQQQLQQQQQQQQIAAFSPLSQTSSNSSIFAPPTSPPVVRNASLLQQKHSTLHELLIKREQHQSTETTTTTTDLQILGQSVPAATNLPVLPSSSVQQNVRLNRSITSRLSSSAPTHLGFEQIWQRREPRQHLLSTGSLAEAGSTSSISTGGVLSPEALDLSHDEELDSDEDSDGHYEDFSSDNNLDTDDDDCCVPTSRQLAAMSKKERYFWQYNLQSKGPKGQRLVMKSKMEDPHVLHEVQDPVFSPDCSVRGIKHSGKARKGDGNDLTPNARKLYSIGKELDKLGNIINDMTPVSELPFNVRPNSRKEKIN